jgi:single-strand DNA-binding protein
MVSFNKTIQAGNPTRDPETKRVTVGDVEGVPAANFGLAVSRVKSQKEDAADFVDVDCWRELGEIVQANKRRGHDVLVTGRLAQDRWKNGQGEARSRVKVVADAVQFTTTGRDKAGANGRSHRSGGGKEGNALAQKKQYRSRYSR